MQVLILSALLLSALLLYKSTNIDAAPVFIFAQRELEDATRSLEKEIKHSADKEAALMKEQVCVCVHACVCCVCVCVFV